MKKKKNNKRNLFFLVVGILIVGVITMAGYKLLQQPQESFLEDIEADVDAVDVFEPATISPYHTNPELNYFSVTKDNGLKICYRGYCVTYQPVFIMENGQQYRWGDIPDTIQKDLWRQKIHENKYKYGADFSNVSTYIKNNLKYVVLHRTSATKTVTVCDEWDGEECIESHTEIQPMTASDIQGRIKRQGGTIILNNKVFISHSDILRTYNIPVINKTDIVIGGLNNNWTVCDEWDFETEECISSHIEFNWIENPDGTWNISFDPTITISEDTVITSSLLTNVTAETGVQNFTHLNISITDPYDSLVGYWSFDGDPYNQNGSDLIVYDFSQHNNDGTGAADAVVNDTNCIYGDCIHFDGTGDYAEVTGVLAQILPITISCWWRPADTSTQSEFFYLGSATRWFALGSREDGSSDFRARYRVNSLAGGHEYVWGGILQANSWYHIVARINSTADQDIFTNGDKVDGTGGDLAADIDRIAIGRLSDDTPSNEANGSVDECMVFNVSLTDQQILDIYNNQSSRFVQKGTQKVRAVNITDTTNWDNAGYNRVNLTASYEANMNSNLSARIGQMNLSVDPDGLVLYMPFEWGSAVDISGEGNDGTLEGDTLFNATGGLNDTGGFEFDGDDDYITIGTGSDFSDVCNNGCTFSAWINKADGTSNGDILARYTSTDDDQFFIFYIDLNEYTAFAISENGNSTFCFVDDTTTATKIQLNTWEHVVAVYNTTDVLLYRDGTYTDDSTTCSFTSINETAWEDSERTAIGIHDEISDSWDFNGTLDDVLIFNRSLSATEISDLYKNQSTKYNVAYYTDYQNLTGTNNIFTIDEEADFVFPDFEFLAGNMTDSFYTPLLKGDITLDIWNFTEEVVADNPPVTTLSFPTNATSTTQGVIEFECNATDDRSLENVTLYIWNSSDGIINTSFATWNGTANSTRFNHTFTFDNQTHWNCLVFDNSTTSQSDWAGDNFTLIISAVDTIYPNISIVYPSNNSNTTTIDIDVNYTYQEANPDSCWWSSDDGANNNSLIDCNTNITGQTWTEGLNNITVYINDSTNNENKTGVTFRLDTTAPDLSIIYPSNNTNTTTTDIDVNYTVSDLGIGLDSCWWSNDSGENNNSLTDCTTNITGKTWLEGNNIIIVWVNDSINNKNLTTIFFTLDTINPNITILSPANNSNTTNSNIEINFSSSDSTLNSCWWSNESGEANNTIACGTNITGKTWEEGSNTIQVWANDSVNHLNTTTVSFTLDTTSPAIANFRFIALNSSEDQIGTNQTAFNFTNLEDIEYMNISFELTDATGIDGDIKIYFTANGTSACSLGNNQSTTCYNFDSSSWIEFANGTDTLTFRDIGGSAQGDSITCSYTTITNGRNYTCEIDEHYNPNVWKHYPLNFSDVKWQSGTNQRIKKNTLWRIELDTLNIPLDADYYKIDFRVNASIGLTPTNELVVYLCNSTYTTGDPSDSVVPECQLVGGKLPADLTDDGTKCRDIFTSALTSSLGDIKYVLITTDSPTSKYYSMKTYGWLGGGSVRTSISNDDGLTYTNLSDGYETELNINWFYDSIDSNTTQIFFKIYSNDLLNNNANSSIQIMTWDEGFLNEPPIVDIITPEINSNYSGTIEINWTTAEPNGNSYTTNVTANNGTTNVTIDSNLVDTISNSTWDTTAVADGFWNITVESCENSTSDLYCGNDTHQILIDNTNPGISIVYPSNNTNTTTTNININYTYSELNPNSCWWSNDSGLNNNSLTDCNTNITGKTWLEGNNNVTVWINDTVNNINYSSVRFIIDTLPPNIIISSPNNNTQTTDTKLDINYTTTDAGVGLNTCWYANDTRTRNVTLTNCNTNITDRTWDIGLHNVTIWVNDTLNNLNYSMVTFEITSGDTIPPDIKIISPSNNSNSSINTLNINYTASDETEIDSCWYANDTMTRNITLTDCNTNITDRTWDDGLHNVSVWANDTTNNLNYSSVTFMIDTSPPNFVNISNQSILNNQTLAHDINATDVLSEISCFTVNDTTNFNINCSGYLKNITGLSVKTYWINITVNDSLNNINSSVIFIEVNESDQTPPNILIIYPSNNTNHSGSGLDINYTASDGGSGLNTCWYSNDTLTRNVTLTNCNTNITDRSWDNGLHNVTVWVNDSANNLNLSTVTFRIDTIAPDIAFTYPSNNTNTTDNGIDVNYTTSDSGVGLDSCWWSEDAGATNTTLDCTTNITGQTWSEGLNNIIVYANDSVNNLNLTAIRFRLDTTAPSMTLQNFSQQANLSFSRTMAVTDVGVGIDTYSLNSTLYFSINSAGLIQNTTNLTKVEIHYLNISVNDTLNNLASGMFYINITEVIAVAAPIGNLTIGGLNKIKRRVMRLVT